MRGYVLKFAQQGIWASLSGGWYYDANHSTFTNVFHLYTWLFLFGLPFVLFLSTSMSLAVHIIYASILILFFACTKGINFNLHYAFDNGEQIQNEPDKSESEPKETEPTDKDNKTEGEGGEGDAKRNLDHSEEGDTDCQLLKEFIEKDKERENIKKTEIALQKALAEVHQSGEMSFYPRARRIASLFSDMQAASTSHSNTTAGRRLGDAAGSGGEDEVDEDVRNIREEKLYEIYESPKNDSEGAECKRDSKSDEVFERSSSGAKGDSKRLSSYIVPSARSIDEEGEGTSGEELPRPPRLPHTTLDLMRTVDEIRQHLAQNRTKRTSGEEILAEIYGEAGEEIPPGAMRYCVKDMASLVAKTGSGQMERSSIVYSTSFTISTSSSCSSIPNPDASNGATSSSSEKDVGYGSKRIGEHELSSIASRQQRRPPVKLRVRKKKVMTKARKNSYHQHYNKYNEKAPWHKFVPSDDESSTDDSEFDTKPHRLEDVYLYSDAKNNQRSKTTDGAHSSKQHSTAEPGSDRLERGGLYKMGKTISLRDKNPTLEVSDVDAKVDKNFRECLENFQQIPKHLHRRGAYTLNRSLTQRHTRTFDVAYTRGGRLRRTTSELRPTTFSHYPTTNLRSILNNPPPSTTSTSTTHCDSCVQNNATNTTTIRPSTRKRHPAGDRGSKSGGCGPSSHKADVELILAEKCCEKPWSNESCTVDVDVNDGDDDDEEGGNDDDDDELLDLCSKPDVHLARNHADTTEGAVHSFQDENGRWMTYTFSQDGIGTASQLNATSDVFQTIMLRSRSRNRPQSSSRIRCRRRSETTSCNTRRSTNIREIMEGETDQASIPTTTGATVASSITAATTTTRAGYRQHDFQPMFATDRIRHDSNSRLRLPEHQQLFDAIRRSLDFRPDTSPSSANSQLELPKIMTQKKERMLYRIKLFPWKIPITIKYDRLALMDLLDRNTHVLEALLAIFLAVLVGVLALKILNAGLLFDVAAFWFCAVVSSSQFSLLRSVQPDSASPTHGHNRIIAYSRPFYFVISACLLLTFNYLTSPDNIELKGVQLYGMRLFDNDGFIIARDFMLYFILVLPGIFLFGLLPQINTFLMYFLEQIDIHVFGGSGATSLLSLCYLVVRDSLLVALLFLPCYGAMLFKERSQHILFSAFCGPLVSIAYHISRQTSSPWWIWCLLKPKLFGSLNSDSVSPTTTGGADATKTDIDSGNEADDVGTNYILSSLNKRLQSDIVLCPIITVLCFAIHCSSMFTAMQPYITYILYILCVTCGFTLHYILPRLRNNYPWLFINRPLLKSYEYDVFEVTDVAQLMWFERVLLWGEFIERNIIYPLLVMNQLTVDADAMVDLYGTSFGCLLLAVFGLKLMRSGFISPAVQYQVFTYSVLFAWYDARNVAGPLIISLFFAGMLFLKIQEFILKLHFWQVYIAPWQISWGSAFHAFAQPFIVPHSVFLMAQAVLSTLIQSPFSPFLGSAIFLSSYARPLKFWERDYNTKRSDHSNTRLATQFDRGVHCDDNNLNSIFYEHLTNSLQKSLAGDLSLGRWGNIYAGDCFILASDHLNAMVHVIERGNGVVTFQLRGLEFTGTYCQQREVEAINETEDSNDSCLCCRLPRPRFLLSFNSAFGQRWLAWQVVIRNYVLDGYSITDNNAASMLGVFDLRKVLVSFIVKCTIFFLIRHDSIESWLNNPAIRQAIQERELSRWVDIDSCFAVTIDDDFDVWSYGITCANFRKAYHAWITHCCERRLQHTLNTTILNESKLVTLCFALSAFVRRALSTAAHNLSPNLDSFLHGLHSLFKGDFRVTSQKDDWVFTDMNLMQDVVQPAVRTALKLHQDHFTYPEEFEHDDHLYDVIRDNSKEMVITHEGDPAWRKAVLSNQPSLLALRRRVVSEAFVDHYSVIKLKYRPLGFSVVKVNRECVRGLWAGQQSELVFMRNRNPERGSIQNAKQVLRNMINSSCDQPIGYPIYVSPLTTSYASTCKQYTDVLRGPATFQSVREFFSKIASCLREGCTGSCNSGGGYGNNPPVTQQQIPLATIGNTTGTFRSATSTARSSSISRSGEGHDRPSLPLQSSAVYKSSTIGGAPTSSSYDRTSLRSTRQASLDNKDGNDRSNITNTSAGSGGPSCRRSSTSCVVFSADTATFATASSLSLRRRMTKDDDAESGSQSGDRSERKKSSGSSATGTDTAVAGGSGTATSLSTIYRARSNLKHEETMTSQL